MIGTFVHLTKNIKENKGVQNNKLPEGMVSCSADSLIVADSFVIRISICGENPVHRKSARFYLNSMAMLQTSNR